jgi:hypothetical protein
MQVFIGEYRATERREIRRTSRSTPEQKALKGKMLEESDMEAFQKVARDKCIGVMTAAYENTGGISELFTRSHVGSRMLDKWALNFMVYLLFASSGQRPQVFSSLLVPETEVMAGWRRQPRGAPVGLRAQMEKTPRAQECPAVQFPGKAAAMIRFHVRHVRPLILNRAGIREGPEDPQTLLLNTRSGNPLSTDEVRSSLGRFVRNQDPELKGITPMVIRSSFASVMFRKYKEGKFPDAGTLEQFLSNLGGIMNTSPEMLMSNYVASNPLDFASSVRSLWRAFHAEEEETELDLNSDRL